MRRSIVREKLAGTDEFGRAAGFYPQNRRQTRGRTQLAPPISAKGGVWTGRPRRRADVSDLYVRDERDASGAR